MTLAKVFWRLFVLAYTVFLTACAHHIQVNPDVADIRAVQGVEKSPLVVAYHIPEQQMLKEVNTPGGGGDTVSYEPYRDAEAALNTVLSRKFERVYSITSPDDSAYLAEKNISYIFLPVIVTASSSSSVFTWIPSNFEVTLTCKVLDTKGNEVWESTVQGLGEADSGEYSKDFGIAGRRAMKDAFLKMLQEINTEQAFNPGAK